MLIDTHAHVYSEYYENIVNIISEAKSNNVYKIFNCAVDYNTCKEVIELHRLYPNLYPILGIHPENSLNYSKKDIEFIENNIDKCIAIGEIGLDYHYENYDKEKQIELFKMMLDIASKHNKPVIIHSRDAVEDTINILKQYNLTGIIHSFSGSLETANIYIKMGYVLGINGVITFKNCNLKNTLKSIDINNIVLETDSPYLAPVPFRGVTNSPKNVSIVAYFICNIYNINIEDLSKITAVTINRIFDI